MTRCVLVALSVIVVLSVLAYNLWAYCCGRCALNNFIDPGPFGFILAGVTVLAGTSLLVLKICHVLWLRRQRCPCGFLPASKWFFCPRCGAEHTPN